MKKIIFILALVSLLVLFSGCSMDKGIETKSTIVNKEEKYGNPYYFYVTYKIEGMVEDFEVTIKIDK